MSIKEIVEVDKAEYDELIRDRDFLRALRGAGVDNWSGYDFAIDEFEKIHPEEE